MMTICPQRIADCLEAIRIELERENFDAAVAALRRLERDRPSGVNRQTALAELFRPEIANALEESLNCIYVRDLLPKSAEWVESVPNIGPKRVAMISRSLAQHGIRWPAQEKPAKTCASADK